MVRSVRPLHGVPFRVSLLMVLLGVLTLPVVASGQGAVPLKVQVIYAANEPGGVDSRLGSLAGELQKTFRYSKYELLDSPRARRPSTRDGARPCPAAGRSRSHPPPSRGMSIRSP